MSGEYPAAFAVTPVTPGDWVGRYELLYPAAQGGMGSVWAARLRGMSVFERLFAIKMVLPQFAAEPSFREMFLEEARIASRIVHPNVSPVIDIGEHQGGLYLVMEWIDGDSIHLMARAAAKRGARLPLPVVLRVLADASGALHAAHELRDSSGLLLDVVHRDISPQNILVSVDGATKLIDFGVAKARGRLHGETSAGFLKGKLKFMAPEQASGKHVDRRADIFGMGAVLFFLLTGEFAYDGPNDASTLHALLGGRPRRPLPPTVPPVVAAIVDRAMQRDPQLRFQTAAELQEALEGALESLSLRATLAVVQACYTGLMHERVAGRARSLELSIRSVEERLRVREILEKSVVPETGGSSGARPSPRGAGRGELFDPVPLSDTGDRPTNPEPFVVRTAAEFDTSYQRIITTSRNRRRMIVASSMSVLGLGVATAWVAFTRTTSVSREGTTSSANISPAVAARPVIAASADPLAPAPPPTPAFDVSALPPARNDRPRETVRPARNRAEPGAGKPAAPATDPLVTATESRK